MNQAFQAAQERSRVPGSAVLNAWRTEHGPETSRAGKLSNENGSRSNLTIEELSSLLTSGGASKAGPTVSEASAMRVSVVYACVALIAGAVSTLPVPVYARTATGREVVDHPYFWLLNEQPEDEISAAVFWEYMVTARLFYGDCFAEIVRPSFRSNRATGFRALHPMRVQPFRDTAGELYYRITPQVGAMYVLNPADIIHVPSMGYDKWRALSPSPITYAAKQSIGTLLATGDYNASFFSNGARPDFALKTKSALDDQQAQLLRSTWISRHGGANNAHLPAILTGGLEIEQLTLSPVDSKILEIANANLEEVCRVLGVPPFMVGSTEKTTSWGTGQENMGRGFVKYTLLRDLRKFEQEFNRKLWPVREKFFIAFDVSGIERGDLKSENEAFRIALGRAGEPGWMSQNEVRKVKLMPPIEGGDDVSRGVKPGGDSPPPEPEPEPSPEPKAE
jgi:HK97 family phage portal protein